jgi:hypothetical protein
MAYLPFESECTFVGTPDPPEVKLSNISIVQYWVPQKRQWINAESSAPYVGAN